jgi:hypothetical protein
MLIVQVETEYCMLIGHGDQSLGLHTYHRIRTSLYKVEMVFNPYY